MAANRISVKGYLVNGSIAEVLINATPKEAIERYFLPDSGAPVQTLVIDIFDSDGKEHSISIFPGGIVVRNIIV